LNLSEIRDLAYKLANSYSADGVLLPLSDVIDMKMALTDFINTAYFKSIQYDPIESVYSITQNCIPNLLNTYSSFNIVQHLSDDYGVSANGVRSYYFEIDHPATVLIEENIAGTWTSLATINATGITSFTEYKGLVTPSNIANEVRLRFSGSYPYNIRRVALYAYAFASVDDIPKFQPYVRYTLPADYISLNRIIQNSDDRLRQQMLDYSIEKKSLLINYYYNGSFDAYYASRPTPLSLDTDSPQTRLENHSYLAYFAAGQWLFSSGQQAQGLTLINMFSSFMTETMPTIDEQNNTIENYSGW